jgi:long-chain acyl-CoA synthetase
MATYFPDNLAVVEGEARLSYRELDRDSGRLAAALAGLGLAPGDRVGLCAPNSYFWLALFYGVLKAGGTAVPLGPALTLDEVSLLLDDCRPRFLYTTPEKADKLDDLKPRPYLEQVFQGPDRLMRAMSGPDHGRFPALDLDRDDPAVILYTGGTTGNPKGAVLSHLNLMTSAHNVAHAERSGPDDRALCFLPLSHVFALIHITVSTIYSGGSLVMQPGFDLEAALAAITDLGITKFYAVPTIYVRLLNLPELSSIFRKVRYCFSAAASMAEDTVRRWQQTTGLAVHEAYGMTESASMVTYNHYYRHLAGSVGTPINTVEVRIMDLEGRVLGPGQDGEICISGPNIMKGYWNRPQETEAAFRGHWFRSGDWGRLDQDGYLYIVDRLKDMIISGGENVYPREVEEALYARPEVMECAVVGLPDEEYGEMVTAFIVPRPGQDIDPADLRAWLKARLAPYKVPKKYFSVVELPKSPAGKILKREIRKNLKPRKI